MNSAKEGAMEVSSQATLLAVFFVSGACGLIHEVTWTRLFTHVMGSSTYAVTVVVSVFMGGLALGGIAAGRTVDRISVSPLKLLILIEAGIGIFALAMPRLIDLAGPLYRLAYQTAGDSIFLLTAIRFGFSTCFLIIPTSLMGATLPVMTRLFSFSGNHIGFLAGRLYSINTFGAVVGVVLAGFVLLPQWGLAKTIVAAAGCNFTACLFFSVLFCKKKVPDSPIPSTGDIQTEAPSSEQSLPVEASGGSTAVRYLLLGYGLSGMAALSYEVAWTRVLAMMIGSSTYAFSLILSAFIAGLALGSGICSRFVRRVKHPMAVMGCIQIAMGLFAVLFVPLLGSLPFFLTTLIARYSGGFWLLQGVEFLLVFAITLAPTMMMGACFPLAAHIFFKHSHSICESTGVVYGANTIGTIFGSALTGLVLIPMLGTQHTIYAASMVNMGAAIVFFVQSGLCRSLGIRCLATVVPVFIAVLAIVVLPPWQVNSLTFAPFYEAVRLPADMIASRQKLKGLAQKPKVLFHKDGVNTTVTVKELQDKSRVLFINGKPDASSQGDLPSQLLVAHLPMIMHPDPRQALVIGLASGITLGAATLHPAEQVDCLEISPTMVEASRYFDEFNYHALDNPKVNLIVGDGRNHLALSGKTYDVIISEPSNPYFAGMADLFTREFFSRMHTSLNEGGLACAWVQTYLMDKETFRSIVGAFQSVFPEMTLWKSLKGDCMMLGAKDKLSVDYAALAARFERAGIQKDLKRIQINGLPDFFGHMLTGSRGSARLAQGAQIHTDDNLLAEYEAPKALMGGNILRIPLINSLEKVRQADFSFITNRPPQACAVFDKAAGQINARGKVYEFFSKKRDQGVEDLALLQEAARLNPEDSMLHDALERFRARAYEYYQKKQLEKAVNCYRTILSVLPRDAKAHYNLATLFRQSGRTGKAFEHYSLAVQSAPRYFQAHYNLARLYTLRQDTARARQHYETVLDIEPEFYPAMAELADLLLASIPRDPDSITRAGILAERAAVLTGHKDRKVLETLALARNMAKGSPLAIKTLKRK